jgi:Na+/proline symporter
MEAVALIILLGLVAVFERRHDDRWAGGGGSVQRLVLAVAGVSIFSLGVTFNYLVALYPSSDAPGIFKAALSRTARESFAGWGC